MSSSILNKLSDVQNKTKYMLTENGKTVFDCPVAPSFLIFEPLTDITKLPEHSLFVDQATKQLSYCFEDGKIVNLSSTQQSPTEKSQYFVIPNGSSVPVKVPDATELFLFAKSNNLFLMDSLNKTTELVTSKNGVLRNGSASMTGNFNLGNNYLLNSCGLFLNKNKNPSQPLSDGTSLLFVNENGVLQSMDSKSNITKYAIATQTIDKNGSNKMEADFNVGNFEIKNAKKVHLSKHGSVATGRHYSLLEPVVVKETLDEQLLLTEPLKFKELEEGTVIKLHLFVKVELKHDNNNNNDDEKTTNLTTIRFKHNNTTVTMQNLSFSGLYHTEIFMTVQKNNTLQVWQKTFQTQMTHQESKTVTFDPFIETQFQITVQSNSLSNVVSCLQLFCEL